jgi:hypothetical protein
MKVLRLVPLEVNDINMLIPDAGDYIGGLAIVVSWCKFDVISKSHLGFVTSQPRPLSMRLFHPLWPPALASRLSWKFLAAKTFSDFSLDINLVTA